MERKFKFAPGEFYHLYSRGVEKRAIFLDDSDHKRFIKLLFISNRSNLIPRDAPYNLTFLLGEGDTLVNIVAYCLMPNHFHILVHEKKEGGISKFMKKLLTSYSMYFNSKYERSGSLFESKFKATHANRDEYMKYLFAYIHLNPIKLIEPRWKETGIKDRKLARTYLNNYQYSSYIDYIGVQRVEKAILNKESAPEYFDTFSDFKSYVNEWLLFDNL